MKKITCQGYCTAYFDFEGKNLAKEVDGIAIIDDTNSKFFNHFGITILADSEDNRNSLNDMLSKGIVSECTPNDYDYINGKLKERR